MNLENRNVIVIGLKIIRFFLFERLFAKNRTSSNRYLFTLTRPGEVKNMTKTGQLGYRCTQNVPRIRLVFVPQLYLN